MFCGVSLVPLKQPFEFITKVPRDYTCSPTNSFTHTWAFVT